MLGACREFVESWPRVSEAYREFAESLLGWRQGVCRKKIERLVGRSSRVAEKLIGSWKGQAHLVDLRSGQHKVQVRIGKVERITFLGFLTVVPLVRDGHTTQAIVIPPRLVVVPPPSYFSGCFR
ncbi:hypothetical protein B296_00003585 [Ensete ventricosum]|uniref:Uncharacterized protein n=1 Tax=Ensete ventricosum TaxID=4639 RepID=A0A427AXW3_ENSVE|nr:hypothetical protein B296_00003585 [Ensete ventricosum]